MTPDPNENFPEHLFHTALLSGLDFSEIGGMTVDEIAFAANAKQAKDKELAQLLAWVVYNGAALTGVAVNDSKHFPKIEDAFPSLFEQKEQQDWWVMKERVEAFNKTHKEK